MSESKNIDGIILAAGLSSRIGSPKALLDYNGINFISNVVLKLTNVCNTIVVVTGHESERVEQSISETVKSKNNLIHSLFGITESEVGEISRRVQFVKNINYEKGMFTSLQAGIESLNNYEHIVYHFVDQPTLPLPFYKRFVNEVSVDTDWLQPIYNGKKGHPIIFSKNVGERVFQSGKDKSLREINKSIENKKYWECDYPEIFDDIDTKSEYNNIILKK